VAPLLALKVMLQNYNTAIPLETFQATMYVGIVIVVIFAFVGLGGAAALVTSIHPDSLDALRARARRFLAVDALAALAAAAGLVLLVRRFEGLLEGRFHAWAVFPVDSPNLLVNLAPAFAAVAIAVRATLVNAAVLTAIVLVLRRLPQPWMRWAVAAAAPFVLLPIDIRTPSEFALEYVIAAATVAAGILFCVFFARGNYLAYALTFWALSLRGPIAELLSIPLAAMRIQGWILVAVLAATVFWAVLPALARRGENAGAGAA
jgi:hypothetical protein